MEKSNHLKYLTYDWLDDFLFSDKDPSVPKVPAEFLAPVQLPKKQKEVEKSLDLEPPPLVQRKFDRIEGRVLITEQVAKVKEKLVPLSEQELSILYKEWRIPDDLYKRMEQAIFVFSGRTSHAAKALGIPEVILNRKIRTRRWIKRHEIKRKAAGK